MNRQKTRRRKPNANRPLLGIIWLLIAALIMLAIVALNTQPDVPGTESTAASDETSDAAQDSQQTQASEPEPTQTVPLTPGWADRDGNRYFVLEDGTYATGWMEYEGSKYYFKEDGTMARGRIEVEGQAFFFTSTGANIMLVNPWNYIPDGYSPELMDLPDEIGEGQRVDSSCYDALLRMIGDCNAAMKEQHTGNGKLPQAYVVSSHRTQEYQAGLYNRKVDSLIAQGYSREEAEKKAATVSAIPGTSEHQLGLAVDIIDTQLWSLVEEQEDLAAQQWLMQNSWRYGFILRYPQDKIDITGIIYEPWHYRYVGNAVAQELWESGLTLEEYLDELS